jgi:hypothetical protein
MDHEVQKFIDQAVQRRKQALSAIGGAPHAAQVHALLYIGDLLAAVMASLPSDDPKGKS